MPWSAAYRLRAGYAQEGTWQKVVPTHHTGIYPQVQQLIHSKQGFCVGKAKCGERLFYPQGFSQVRHSMFYAKVAKLSYQFSAPAKGRPGEFSTAVDKGVIPNLSTGCGLKTVFWWADRDREHVFTQVIHSSVDRLWMIVGRAVHN